MSKAKTVKRTDNIEKMDFDQLRKAVQLLRDDVDLWRRKYEDAIQNLDEDNFGKSFTMTQNNMKAQIKANAQEISTKITAEDLGGALVNYSTILQTAEQIQTAVISVNNATDEKLKNYSTVEQTADAITSTVTSEYVTNLIGSDIVTNATMESAIQQSATEIKQTVSAIYETKSDAEDAYDDLYSEISQTARSITSRVVNLETFQESVFTQTSYGFTLDGEQTTFTGVIFLTDADGNKAFSFFFDDSQGYEQVMMHNCDGNTSRPIVIGDFTNYASRTHNVYIGQDASGNEVATRGWVKANNVAVFG